MSFSENDTFSFWENDAVSEIGTVLEFVPRLQNLGHMAGPHTENGANHLGLPSDSAIGPSNLGPDDFQLAPITGLLVGVLRFENEIKLIYELGFSQNFPNRSKNKTRSGSGIRIF